MSFILDALRKSDQQRQRSATPTLTSAQAPALEARQPALWWYGLIAAVLVAAGIFIGWMQKTPAEPSAQAVPPIIGKSVDTKAATSIPSSPSAEPVRKPEPGPTSREPLVTTAAPAAPAPSPPQVVQAKPATPAVPAPASTASSPREVITPSKPDNSVPPDSPKESPVLLFSELPPNVQQEIPRMSILAHSYSSKPKSRFVFINDRMVHEDESPAPGLKLEQITPDGMIFSYRGYRFRRSPNSD